MFKKIPRHAWILLAIILIGIFLRTYNFHDWLYFGEDQAHDATITGAAAEGEIAWPLLGADMGNTNFRLGPMYYYFQIMSAKIFGNTPDVLAYPDLLFSILAIPLFYLFLKRYFDRNIALAVTGIYSISFYMIRYSRFAWNPNPMPFFILLFLLAFLEFIENKEKTKIIWIALIGFSMGIGMQLHAMLLMIMPAFAFLVFIYLMKESRRVWDKWALIFLVIIVLNLGQIISEVKTNCANSKIFLLSFTDKSQSGGAKLLDNLESNIDCHMQANLHIISSLGGVDNCTFYYTKLMSANGRNTFTKIAKSGIGSFIFLFFGIIFSVMAYGLLGYYLKTERDQKKRYFLGLIVLYLSLYFLVMMVSIKEAPLRYFLPASFAPFLFVGLILQFISRKYPSKKIVLSSLILIILIIANLITIRSVSEELSRGARSSYKYSVLGEVEQMVAYMQTQSGSQKKAYIGGKERYVSNLYRALAYVSQRQGLTLLRDRDGENNMSGLPVFSMIESPLDGSIPVMRDNQRESYKNFGKVSIYKLKN
jgi:4-amino-4-deoxy-L-arabinose transferase-like glycosyltransferase